VTHVFSVVSARAMRLGSGVAVGLLLASHAAMATDINHARAQYNYQMFCQGCHTPDGSGYGDIPPLKNMMGTFLRSDEGRGFLVRVPGSATSKLSNADLAEVLNWTLENFAGASLPEGSYEPYSAVEVSALRAQPLQEIQATRASILAEIAMQTP